MVSPLPLILIQHAYFYGGLPNIPPITPDLIQDRIQNPSIDDSMNASTPEFQANRTDYIYTPGIGFHKFHITPANWNTARLICKAEGGHLAIINSVAESELISRLWVKFQPIEGPGDPDHAYVGIHDLFKKNQWVTIHDQSLEEAGFAEWDDGEPSDSYGNEHCGSVVRSGKLNDIDCGYLLFGFICELPEKEPYLTE